jgi:CHASE2 domain-containing sensor protein
MSATADPAYRTGRRYRVVAIGSGLGGLTATKALKHAEMEITDALVFLTRITAQSTALVHYRTSLWLQVIPTTAAVFATVGVLVALYAKHVAPRAHRRDGRV